MLTTSYISESQTVRETRTPVRRPDQRSGGIFQGWGPKF